MDFIRMPYRRPTRPSSFEVRIRTSAPPASCRPRLVSEGQPMGRASPFAFLRGADVTRPQTDVPRTATERGRESVPIWYGIDSSGGIGGKLTPACFVAVTSIVRPIRIVKPLDLQNPLRRVLSFGGAVRGNLQQASTRRCLPAGICC